MILLRASLILGSKWTTAALFVCIILSYVFFSLAGRPYEAWTGFLLGTFTGLVIYLGLAVNIACAAVRTAYAKLKSDSASPEAIREMDANIEAGMSMDEARDFLKSLGFRKFDEHGNTILSEKGRLSFLPGVVLRAGIVVLMISVLVSVKVRVTDEAVMTPDGVATLHGENFSLLSVDADLPQDYLQVGSADTFSLEDVSANLTGPNGRVHVTSGLPTGTGSEQMRVVHLGYVQPIRGTTGLAEFEWDVLLDVLPPGKSDASTLLSSDSMLSFTLSPVRSIERGLVTGKVYDLKNPRYELALIGRAGGDTAGPVTVGLGEKTVVSGVEISLGQAGLYVKILAVRDPALPWINVGLLVTLAGLALMPLRFIWYEKRASAFRTYDSILIGYKEEFFKRWGIMKFHRLAGNLVSRPKPDVKRTESTYKEHGPAEQRP